MTPATPVPTPERVRLPWRLTLAMFASCAGGELGEPARQIAQAALAEVEAEADRREARVAARGQLRLPITVRRSYPRVPIFRRRRRRNVHATAST